MSVRSVARPPVRRDAGTAVWEQVAAGLSRGLEAGLRAASSTWLFGHTPPLSGSGKLGTPWERMQWEKASGWEVGEWELGAPPGSVNSTLYRLRRCRADLRHMTPGEPPHAVASRASPAVTIIAIAARAFGGQTACDRHARRPLSSSQPSSSSVASASFEEGALGRKRRTQLMCQASRET